ncbi:MAG: hypothetical protein HND47_22835 [Chloroflexi bacterium]|nr:hypothetical protein [Chloroflexota bacterium]
MGYRKERDTRLAGNRNSHSRRRPEIDFIPPSIKYNPRHAQRTAALQPRRRKIPCPPFCARNHQTIERSRLERGHRRNPQRHARHPNRAPVAQEKYDAVFAIGGDGTVGQVASGLVNTETALGVLPAGTTNVWAVEQGQKPFSWLQWWNLRDNARLLANVQPQRVDVGLCNDRPFLLWAGVGLDAQTINKIEPRAFFQARFGAALLCHHRMGGNLLARTRLARVCRRQAGGGTLPRRRCHQHPALRGRHVGHLAERPARRRRNGFVAPERSQPRRRLPSFFRPRRRASPHLR